MKTVLVCGGKIEDSFALSVLEKLRPDYIIAIDRGLEFCYKYNIVPQYILGDFGLEINDRNPARFFCNCSKSRVARALISLGKKELDGMIRDGEPVEVNCDFCGRSYTFDVEELQGLLEQAVRR